MQLNRQKKDLILVGLMVGLIFGANAGIYYYYGVLVPKNYFEIPDENTPYYHKLFIFVILERNMSQANFPITLLNSAGERVLTNGLMFYGMNGSHYIHYVDFMDKAHAVTLNYSDTYRFFFEYRLWYSEYVVILPGNYFEWV